METKPFRVEPWDRHERHVRPGSWESRQRYEIEMETKPALQAGLTALTWLHVIAFAIRLTLALAFLAGLVWLVWQHIEIK